MSDKTVAAIDPIVQRLRALAQSSPDLEETAQRYATILPLLHDANLHVGTIPLTTEQAREKMRKGQPLLFGIDLDIDLDSVRDLIIKLSRALGSPAKTNGSQMADAARCILITLEENGLDISVLLPLAAAGQSGPIVSYAHRLGLDSEFLVMLLQNALKPALREWCRQLTPLVEGIEWHKGFCFVCGAVASLGELQENNQTMHLRCGQCGADWPFRRLLCLYCGNEDHDTRRFLYLEKERDKMRVDVCDECKGYLKVIAAFSPTPPEMLPLEDLATLYLDYIAQERGYMRGIVRQSTPDKIFPVCS